MAKLVYILINCMSSVLNNLPIYLIYIYTNMEYIMMLLLLQLNDISLIIYIIDYFSCLIIYDSYIINLPINVTMLPR